MAPVDPWGTAAAASDQAPSVQFRWDDRPSLRVGRALRLDFIAKFQVDGRAFEPAFEGQPDDVELTRRRLGVTGELLGRVSFEFEADLRRDNPIRDAFADVSLFDRLAVKGGKFKIPFSVDELTSEARLDFIYRSRLSDNFAPGRDIGATLHGRVRNRLITYEAGVFRRDGENARFGENPGAGATAAARVTARPLRGVRALRAVRDLELGVSATRGWVAEGLNGLRAVTASDVEIFSPVYVKGLRSRLGADMVWRPGPLSFRAEALGVSDERREQSVTNRDLPDAIGRGWYASAAWMLTGEPKADRIDPRRDLLPGRGPGAFEVAARYESIRVGSRDHPGPPFRNPRAPNILGNRDLAWTFGVNWYLNAWSKMQVNAIRERIEDTTRAPVAGRDVFWTYVTRLQFAM